MCIIAVDIDGTICSPISKCYAKKEIKHCKPYNHMIKTVNELYDRGNFIYLYTHRPSCCERQTKIWLKKYKVKYNNIVFGKLGANLYIDNKSLQPYRYLNAEMIEDYTNQIKSWDFNLGSFRGSTK